jgi:RecA-family ATPase
METDVASMTGHAPDATAIEKAKSFHYIDQRGREEALAEIRRSRKGTRKSFEDSALGRDGLLALPDPVAVVEGWLYEDSLAWMSGPPGCGKSFAALDIACSVATGHTWHDHKVKRGHVVYVVAESPRGFKKGLPAWEHANTSKVEEITYLPEAVQLTDPDDMAEFTEFCLRRDPALIVIDTQSRCTVGVDENNARDMTPVIDALDRLRTATGACVLTVHHTPRSAANLRGSNSQEGAATTVIAVAKDGAAVELSADVTDGGKQKDVQARPKLRLGLCPVAGSAALIPAMDVLKKSEQDVLRVLGGKDVMKMSMTALQGSVDHAPKTVQRAVRVLTDKGYVRSEQEGRNRYIGITPEGARILVKTG